MSWSSFVPGAMFVVGFLVFLATGLLCLAFPPQPDSEVGETVIPDSAKCLRVTRHANYASVEMVIGSSLALHHLLLRLDIVKGVNDTALRLFSNRVAESEHVTCDDTMCTDVALLQLEGPRSDNTRVVVQFLYNNPTTESLAYGVATTMHMDGELALQHGHEYFLTTTHFCWTDAVSTSVTNDGQVVHARVHNGALVTDAVSLAANSVTKTSPASQAHADTLCGANVGSVSLFPGAAAVEATWLRLASQRAYELSPEGVDDRRAVVEVGQTCAAKHSAYQRAYSLYQLDCQSAYVDCDNEPSLPFRRVATSLLWMRVGNGTSEDVHLRAVADDRLLSLPSIQTTSDAMLLALVKLGLMTLAAAVTWVRANRSTSSMDLLFLHCVRAAHVPTLNRSLLHHTVIWEDAMIGATAIAARLAVSIWRINTLMNDGQFRAPVVQLAAGVLSLLHWTTRYFVLDRQIESPLAKLGGSTALVDSTCAVMLGFAQSPVMAGSFGRFDPTARLLTAILISTMTVQRCLFATACCGLLWAVASDDAAKPVAPMPTGNVFFSGGEAMSKKTRFDSAYPPWAFAGIVMWLLQTASVAILMADLFAAPLAHSMTRASACGWSEVAMTIFAACAASGLPALLRTTGYIASTPVWKTAEDSE